MKKLPRILIVDDNPDHCWIIKRMLDETGQFESKSVCDAEEALALMGESEPDLVLLDLRMSGRSGGWLYKEMQKDRKLSDVPVIVLSCLVERRDGQILPDTPEPDDLVCLWKPVDPHVLIGAVQGEIVKKSRLAKD
ncbi:MAG: response regulator [Verrucomicrobiales bacterium]|nr:response regulator [Verrucomicrobiales bacterium]